MVPLILGGVALAATGFGIAKLFEEKCHYVLSDDLVYEDIEEIEDEFIDGVGYPTREFFVDLSDDESDISPKDKSIGEYDLAKIELYNTSFKDLTTALNEIDNLPEEVDTVVHMKLAQTIYPFKDISEELLSDFDKHKEILKNTKLFVDSKSDELDEIITNNNNFEEYKDEDKKLIQTLITIFKLTDSVIFTRITSDHLSITREIKRTFKKVEKLIQDKAEL